MALERVTPDRAKKLVETDGYTILDVRSAREYREGHPAGSINIPYLEEGPYGMIPNEHFIDVVRATFPNGETKLITSCQMGGRSVRAANELSQMGYKNVLDLRGGFGGEKNDAGQVVVQGWKDSGYAVEAGDSAGRSYADVRAKAGVQAPEAPKPKHEDAHGHGHSHGHGHGHEHGGGHGHEEGGLTSGARLGAARFAHPTATILCARFQQVLPALKRTPVGGELGVRIRSQFSALAWSEWVEHSKLLINEYRLNPAEPRSQSILLEQCEAFFFGEGAKRPDEFVKPGEG